jgi:Ca2+/Na+ antiporter
MTLDMIFGMNIFGIMWELSKLAANLVMIVLALFLGYALFTGKLDEWIESTVERDTPDNTKAGKDATMRTRNKSKPDKKRRL